MTPPHEFWGSKRPEYHQAPLNSTRTLLKRFKTPIKGSEYRCIRSLRPQVVAVGARVVQFQAAEEGGAADALPAAGFQARVLPTPATQGASVQCKAGGKCACETLFVS